MHTQAHCPTISKCYAFILQCQCHFLGFFVSYSETLVHTQLSLRVYITLNITAASKVFPRPTESDFFTEITMSCSLFVSWSLLLFLLHTYTDRYFSQSYPRKYMHTHTHTPLTQILIDVFALVSDTQSLSLIRIQPNIT